MRAVIVFYHLTSIYLFHFICFPNYSLPPLNEGTSQRKITLGTTCLEVYDRHVQSSWPPEISPLKIRMNSDLSSKVALS